MKKFLVFLSKIFFKLFYQKKFLCGVHFDHSNVGWKWCWKVFVDQKIKGYNRHVPFPVNPTTVVGNVKNLHFDNDNMDNFWKTGCYYQCWKGRIYIGKGTWIAQNVGIITENHDPSNLTEHMPPQDVHIGENCWIGMNSVILPGVVLGDQTIVGAGAVVSHSFEEGHCVIAGVPAKVIKKL